MFHEKLKIMRENPEFKEWKEKNKQFFLAHAFFIEGGNWQFGFYNTETSKMVTFTCGEKITCAPEEEVLKSEKEITELNPEKIKIKWEDAKKTAEDLIKSEYKNQLITKNFVIIQTVELPVFNITFLGQNFKTINIKIDAETGKIITHSEQKLASF